MYILFDGLRFVQIQHVHCTVYTHNTINKYTYIYVYAQKTMREENTYSKQIQWAYIDAKQQRVKYNYIHIDHCATFGQMHGCE